ncbi:hypothetical protein MTP99_017268 [Tenebrio molitor]|nr:hypothetical protein MTP99_017268 [Tenebrio molitor]
MTLFQGGKYLYLSALIANILPFIVGVVSAWSSSVIPHLENDDLDQIPIGRKINQTEASWIGSLTAMGAIFSSLIFGYFTQKIGRKAMGIIVYQDREIIPREKLSLRPLTAGQDNFENVKGFRGQGVHNIFVQPKICVLEVEAFLTCDSMRCSKEF